MENLSEEMKDGLQEWRMSLSEYLIQVKEVMEEADGFPGWVVCELANVNWNRGHCYLELVETGVGGVVVAKTRGTIWSYRAAALGKVFEESCGAPLRAGIKVMLYVKVQMSELYGFSLNVLDLDPSYTLGDLEAKKQATLKRLAEEDLLERNKELEVPALPYRIAIVSASGAAGYGDFMKHLSECGVAFETELFEAAMQGETAPESIAEAFARIDERSLDFDVVAFIRGGGSNLDLACFDEYLVSRSIALCNLPVISGIGHERDNHVCDEVAAVRVKTPTGAADFIIERFSDAYENITSLEKELRDSCRSVVEEKEALLEKFSHRLSASLNRYTETRSGHLADIARRFSSSVSGRLVSQDYLVAGYFRRIADAASRKITAQENLLDRMSTLFEGADPSRILERGYGIILKDGQKVSDITQIAEGSKLTLMMRDGKVSFTATGVTAEKKD